MLEAILLGACVGVLIGAGVAYGALLWYFRGVMR